MTPPHTRTADHAPRAAPGTARLELTPAQFRTLRRALTVYGDLSLDDHERGILARLNDKVARAAERTGTP